MRNLVCLLSLFFVSAVSVNSQVIYSHLPEKKINLSVRAREVLKGKKILYVERSQHARSHHNTETMSQKGSFTENDYIPGGALRIYDVDNGSVFTLLETSEGVIRDPELSYDARKIIFSMRKDFDDYFHIYEINVDGSNLRQLTFASGISDLDPMYLPDGDIVFSSTRLPKICMCNRHVQGNLYRMRSDGSNIIQIGVNTLFETHPSMLSDGRILYTRWEYVDRNFGDAQGLWIVNPDGTKHAIYYGNNTPSPGGVLDGRQIPGTDLVVCTFAACHERAWGAIAILDRKKGVDNKEPVEFIWPRSAINQVGNYHYDTLKGLSNFYEDPYPIDKDHFLVSRTLWVQRNDLNGYHVLDSKSALYLLWRQGAEEIILEGEHSIFDPMIIEERPKPARIPTMRNYTDDYGQFYVENVYEGTHMKGVKPGTVKYLRVVESPEKRTWAEKGWVGDGEQPPGMNWLSFENKRIIGEVPVEDDGSVSFYAPSYKHLFFQLLDKDKRMIQSMRSGVSLMPGEVNGCIGCHEDRLNSVPVRGRPTALSKKPSTLSKWMGLDPHNFSYMEHVQPILDRHCVRCHDFDSENRDNLVLSRDKNPFFNASYISLHMSGWLNLVGAGPAAIQEAYSWGSNASRLTGLLDDHHGVSLSKKEKEIMYTWMDLNGVYYPVYETSFSEGWAGRCPLTDEEVERLCELTGLDFTKLNTSQRKLGPQISFDRPEKSPCLDSIRHDREKYREALSLLRLGRQRLRKTPRGDIEKDLVICEKNKEQLRKYIERLEENRLHYKAESTGSKYYDKKD